MLQLQGHRDSVLLLLEASITKAELNRVQQPGMLLEARDSRSDGIGDETSTP
jgi:hypothetical protein